MRLAKKVADGDERGSDRSRFFRKLIGRVRAVPDVES